MSTNIKAVFQAGTLQFTKLTVGSSGLQHLEEEGEKLVY
jgi:hypothetical protein